MRSFLIKLAISAFGAWLLGIFLHWWTVAIPAAAAAYFFRQKGIVNFFSGFFGVFLLWFILGMVIQMQTGSVLPSRFSEVFTGLKSPFVIGIISGMVGGIGGGLGALFGGELKKWKS